MIKVDRAKLANGINRALRVVAGRANSELLKCVHVSGDENALEVTAHNNVEWIQVTIPGCADGKLDVMVNGADLLARLKAFTTDEIGLDHKADERQLFVRSINGKSKLMLHTIPIADRPKQPKTPKQTITVDRVGFVDAIARAIVAQSIDTDNKSHGVSVEADIVSAKDGRRFHVVPFKSGIPGPVSLSGAAVKALDSLDGEKLALGFDESRVAISSETCLLVVSRRDQEPPAFMTMLSNIGKLTDSATFVRVELREAIDQIKVTSDICVLSQKGDAFTLASEASDEVELAGVGAFAAPVFKVDAGFLRDAIDALEPGDDVHFESVEATSPTDGKPTGHFEYAKLTTKADGAFVILAPLIR